MQHYSVIRSKKAFSGRIIDVVQDTILLPDGREAMREVVVHNGAAAILAIDVNGDIVFVRQYRHPAKELVLEIPAGTLEPGENPLECARRELEEETALKVGKLSFLFKMYSAVGFCTEVLYIYLAEQLSAGVLNLDPDEFVTVERHSLDAAIAMVFDGRIKDSKTIAAILAYDRLKRAQ